MAPENKLLLLLNHSGFRRYFKNTTWVLGEKIIRLVMVLFVGIWVARYLGPESFGTLNYALAFSAIFGPIVSLGLDSVLVRELVNTPENEPELLGTAFILKLVVGVLTWGFVAVLAFSVTKENPSVSWMILIISSGYIFQSLSVIDLNFRAKVQLKYSSIIRTAIVTVIAIVKVWLILSNADVIYFAAVSVLELNLIALGYWLIYQSLGYSIIDWKFSVKRATILLKDSWPAILTGISVMLYMRTDQIMLGQILGNESVGLYSAAIRISQAWYIVPTIVAQALFPAIANAKKADEEMYKKRLNNLFTFLVLASYLVAIPMTFFSRDLMLLLYGELYESAYMVLTIHIWTGVFVSLGVASGSWYNVENLLILSFYRALLGAVLNIALNIFLIARLGIVGCAIASLAAQIFSALLFDLFLTRTRPLFKLKIKALVLVFKR